jgi:hypothetical protein
VDEISEILFSKPLTDQEPSSRSDFLNFRLAPCRMWRISTLFFLSNTRVDHTINMRLVAIQQVPQPTVLRCCRAAIRMFFQTKNGLLEAFVPAAGRVGVRSVDVLIQLG